MKDLAATATGTTPADRAAVFALLSDFESYPRWYPSGVRGAEVLERDPDTGKPTKVKTTLYAKVGPISREFKLHLKVITRELELVDMQRLPKDPRDHEEMQVTWNLVPATVVSPGGTAITVALKARLSIPPLVPVGGVADSMAKGFLNAALRALT
jgi:ribosome-associated toxin RatA of RatAB toxin-antitoxin module